MKTIEMLELLTNYAKAYRKDAKESISRNKHMNEIEKGRVIEQRVIDAILVDYINYVGARNGCDYALYAKDLEKSVIIWNVG